MTSQWGWRSSLFCLRDVIDCRWRWEQSRFPQKYSSFSHLYFTNRETNAASVCFSLKCYVEILPSVFFCIGFPEEKGASKIMSFSVILCVVISCSVFQGGCLAWLGFSSPLLLSLCIMEPACVKQSSELWQLGSVGVNIGLLPQCGPLELLREESVCFQKCMPVVKQPRCCNNWWVHLERGQVLETVFELCLVRLMLRKDPVSPGGQLVPFCAFL